MVSRGLNEQISLNKTSIYSNQSASRLPATVGRRTGDATFLKGPVSILRLTQLVAELENSLVAWVRRSIMKKVQFHSCTFTWGHAEGASEWKNIRCLQFKFTLLFIYILSGTFFSWWSRFTGLESFRWIIGGLRWSRKDSKVVFHLLSNRKFG